MNQGLSSGTNNHFKLDEKDKQIAQMQKMIDEKNEQLSEYREVKKDFELTTMWLCGYVMELHDFRNGIFKVNKDTRNLEAVMDYVVGQFPMLQGSSNHRQFEYFGKQVNVKDINENIKNVMKILREKTDLK